MTRYLPLIAFVLAIAGCKGCHDQSAETADAAVSEATNPVAPTPAAPGALNVPMRAQSSAHIERNPDGTLSIVKDGEVKRLPKRILQNPHLTLPSAQTAPNANGQAPAPAAHQ